MTIRPSAEDFARIAGGFDANPARSLWLRAEACTDPNGWRWNRMRSSGAVGNGSVTPKSCACQAPSSPPDGRPLVVIVRDEAGPLRAFYNACKHRVHKLLRGEGSIRRIMCPCHA